MAGAEEQTTNATAAAGRLGLGQLGRGLLGLALLGLVAPGCSDDGPRPDPTAWTWNLPEGFPEPTVPEDDPMTVEKVVLGRHLFYETRLSGNQTQSCASCHLQELAFTDGRALAIGSTGEAHPRNSMSLVNVAYAPTLNWANPVVRELHVQALTPMFGDDPVELGLDNETMRERLADDEGYQELFEAAYPQAEELFTVDQVSRALAAFQRSIVSADAPYDRYLSGDTEAIGLSAREGIALFFSEKFECFHCHGGFNLSSAIDHEGNVFDQSAFFNNALYNVDGEGGYPRDN
ncbi:MAG: cytochrome c peroxidase, partial [Myxococcota bacterium]